MPPRAHDTQHHSSREQDTERRDHCADMPPEYRVKWFGAYDKSLRNIATVVIMSRNNNYSVREQQQKNLAHCRRRSFLYHLMVQSRVSQVMIVSVKGCR